VTPGTRFRARAAAWRLFCVLALLGASSAASGCREPGDIRVTSFTLKGTHAIDAAQVKAVLATKASGWLPWSPKQYFDRAAFDADLGRIRRFYQDRGYPDARVTDVDVAFNDARDAVALTITIDEGAPTIAEAVHFTGFDVLSGAQRARLEALPPKPGQPRDRGQVAAARQHAIDLLRNNGYAYGDVEANEAPGSAPGRVVVTFAATPGPHTVFGPITYVGLKTLTDRVVGRQLSFRAGQEYRHNLVVQSQRRLATFEILQFVNVEARPPEGTRPTAVPVTVTVAESPPRKLTLGLGYGSEDRVRASADWSHLNFLGNARSVTTSTKWSSIDRGVRASLSQPYLYHRGLSLEFSANTWWTNEQTYDSHTYGGRIGVRYRMIGRGRGRGRAPAGVIRAAYVHEYVRYGIHPDALADLANVQQLLALGLDPILGRGRGTRAAVDVDVERNIVDNALDPTRGIGISLHTEQARPWLGRGTFRYSEYLADGRGYLPLATSVLALRARYGTLVAQSDADVPFSERYFLGGASSLRGWGRYEVAPLVNGIPVGGRTLLDLSAELRVPVRGPLGAVAFFDAGNVWAGNWAAHLSDLRRDAGLGLRYRTPVGLIRADLGVQLGSIPDLLVNGQPEPRHWRLHFGIGQSF
jgi:outer membrane protein assembly complex protein YaeT